MLQKCRKGSFGDIAASTEVGVSKLVVSSSLHPGVHLYSCPGPVASEGGRM